MDKFIINNIKKSIVLIGMMGAGKTTLGQRLANKLKIPFIDIDKQIEEHLGYDISYIFDYQGEDYFRKLEKEFIEKAVKEIAIISPGGGAFIQEDIRETIKNHSISIWLKAELDILYDRVKKRKTRPILEKGDKKIILSELIEDRYPIYRQADITITCNDNEYYITINNILDALSKFIDSD